MGLLDDAIREHLELRRRQGADASEVARLEQEALGPVVRGETLSSAPVAADPELPEVGEHQLAPEDVPSVEQPLAEPAGYESLPEDPHEHQEVLATEAQPVFQDHHETSFEPELPLDHAQVHDPLPGEPVDPVGPVVEHEAYVPPAGVGQPTEEYDVEAVHAAVHGGEPAEPAAHEQQPLEEGDAVLPHEAQPDGVHAPAGEQPGSGPAEGEPEAGAEPAEDVLEQTPEFLEETPEHDRLWFEQAPPKDFDFDR